MLRKVKCTDNWHPELVVVSTVDMLSVIVDVEVIVVPAGGGAVVVKLTRLLYVISSFMNTLHMTYSIYSSTFSVKVIDRDTLVFMALISHKIDTL